MSEDLKEFPAELHERMEAVFEARVAGLKGNRDQILAEKKTLESEKKALEASVKALDKYKEGNESLVSRIVEASVGRDIAIHAVSANLMPEAISDAVSTAINSKAFTYDLESGEVKGPRD